MQAGTLEITGSGDFANLSLSGGTLDGAGDVSVSGTFDWTAGTLSGNGNFVTAGVSTVTANATLSRDWNNEAGATVDWQSGSLTLAANLVNLGTFRSSASSSLLINAGFSFDNRGLFSNDANTDLGGSGSFLQSAGTLRLNGLGVDFNISGLAVPTLTLARVKRSSAAVLGASRRMPGPLGGAQMAGMGSIVTKAQVVFLAFASQI